MFKYLALVSFVLLSIGASSATPVQRASCNPNAQGQPVSIQSEAFVGLEWGLAAPSDSVVVGESYRGLAAPDWFVRQSGQFPVSYIITDVTSGLAVTINGGELTLNPVNNAEFQPNQVFDIDCSACGIDVTPGNVIGSGCTISPHNVSSCISIGPEAPDNLQNLGCPPTPSSEFYNLLT